MILQSLRARIIGLYLLLLAALVGGFGVFLYVFLARAFLAEVDEEVRDDAERIAARFVEELAEERSGAAHEVQRELDAVPRYRGLVEVRREPDGSVFVAPAAVARTLSPEVPAPDGGKRGFSGIRTVDVRGAPRREYGHRAISVRFEDGTGGIWVCRYALSLRPLKRRLERFVQIYAAAALGLLAVSAGAGWILARRALKPVREMAEAARRMDRESLHGRLPVPPSRDEIRYLAETLNGLLGRVEEAFREVERVTADAAHELRTPIQCLRAEIELSLARARDPAADTETLSGLLASVAKLSGLVEDILFLARADANALAVRFVEVPVRPLLDGIRETAEILAAERGIRVESAPAPDGLAVRGDAGMLERLLLNLAHNGIRHNRDGGVLRLSAAAAAGRVRIRIEDTGGGIPADRIPFLFRRFYRGDQARSPEGGVGLGLAIADAIARTHGGEIEVESEPGKGSAFTAVLPAGAAAPAPAGAG